MADKRDQFSISERHTFGAPPAGEWLIKQAKWQKFDARDGGYWSFHDGEVVWRTPVLPEDEDGDAWPPARVRAEYERLIGYDPEFDPGSQANLVELVSDEDGGFDQPCMFGNRVEGHAVYCHNSKWLYSPRKCRRTWYTGGKTRDEDCEGFCPNPHFKPKSKE